jgi:anthranilate synthase/aminodeoxychorismate synthase-like glutamine amidotransferase
MRVLVIDNYDSFVYNLVQYVGELGASPLVYRNDQLTLEKAQSLRPHRIIISPGPGSPDDTRFFGVCSDILTEMSNKIPTLGVCLGHQGIVHVCGGHIVKAKRLFHGKTSTITHDGKGLFTGVRNPLVGTRYHSLVAEADSLPVCLEVSARSLDDDEIMGVRHKILPIEGIQFHPESILTKDGMAMMKNFLDGVNR